MSGSALTSTMVAAAAVWLSGCASTSTSSTASSANPEVEEFLRMYNETYGRLYGVSAESAWRASTDVTERHTGESKGAEASLSAFRGSRYVIESARRFLATRQELTDPEFRQIDKILLNAADSPGTIPEIVEAKREAEARLATLQERFTYCLEGSGAACRKTITPAEIDGFLASSRDLVQRRRYWEISKQNGPPLKRGLEELRDLRNRTAAELGYTSYFHLQVADYGMTVDELGGLMNKAAADLAPLHRQLNDYARRKLAERYKQPVPAAIPAHWLGDRWGRRWPEIAGDQGLNRRFEQRQPRWIVEQAERFYTSMGLAALPKVFWVNSDLYLLPPGSGRTKEPGPAAWHVDLEDDIRALMSVAPDFQWFRKAHSGLALAHYFAAYSNEKVPVVLREGLNRAFHEAVAELAALAAGQEPYLRAAGVLTSADKIDENQHLLAQALDDVVFLPWAAGTMTRFQMEIYEKRLGADQFNRRWWELAAQYQGITPPGPRGEEHCDACTVDRLVEDSAHAYDHAMARLLKYQLHDYIARKILNQDPRRCNYAGNKEVGRWLLEIMSLGATRDWRQVLKEKTGEDLSARAMVDYFRPLEQYLTSINSGTAEPATAASRR